MAYRVFEFWDGGSKMKKISKRVKTYEEALEIAKTSPLFGEGKRTYGEEGVVIRLNSGRKNVDFF